jgi:2-C-methyl-D-erythritol 2,4-cyclodiphosphate synthase
MSYAREMRAVISSICKVGTEDVSVKATTNEKLGFIGREEGVSAYAVALLLPVSGSKF